MRPSIRHVAERAAVSPVTVSNVLRGRDKRTSPETRARVLLAARELNYIPVAQPMVQSRRIATRIIGIVIDSMDFNDPWSLLAYNGLRRSAEQYRYDLLTLHRAPHDSPLEREEMRFLDRRCDAFIFVAPAGRETVMEALVRHRIPAVSCYFEDVPEGVATVALDNVDAMQQAVRHLVANGHRRIAHLAGDMRRTDFQERRDGYCNGMREAALEPAHIVEARDPADWENEKAQLIELVKRGSITAIACANDGYGCELWREAEEKGLRVPRDLSLVGLDDLPSASQLGLTTIRVAYEDVGGRAIDAVIELIGGADASQCHKVVPVELVRRSSVAPQL